MPTAAKLVAAVVFAMVAYLAAMQYAPVMPEGRPTGLLAEVSALIGLLCGWFIMGDFLSRPRGRIEAMGTGVRVSVTMAFVTLIVFSIVEMMERAIEGRYKSPMEAVLDIFGRALSFGQPILTPGVLAALALGGLFGGAVAHWAAARWK